MKIFMIGGTGLLGCEAARIFIERGHEVTSVALPPLPEGAPIPKEMKLEMCNIYEKSDDEIRELLKGHDCFVFAAGIDERVDYHKRADYHLHREVDRISDAVAALPYREEFLSCMSTHPYLHSGLIESRHPLFLKLLRRLYF